MKKFYSLLMFLLLVILPVPIAYAGEDDRPFTDENGDISDMEAIESTSDIEDFEEEDEDLAGEILTGLDEIDLILEEETSKIARSLTKKIEKAIDLINNAEGSDDLDQCESNFDSALDLIYKAVDQLEKRTCTKPKPSKRCISQDTSDEILPLLEDVQSLLEDVVSIDDDEDGVMDVCSF
ncbi:MAG: hypothetical protein HYY52_08235 [Candidatus Melainabacteria bacterium]|nr:hypothetical protein [Candidatus Melainabacteria bacterium]